MISGQVRSGEAVIPLVLAGANRELEISAVVDTGFQGTLTLPSKLISEFGHGKVAYSESILADGSSVEHQSMFVTFYFPGDPRHMYRERVLELGHEPLVGMRLLEGFRLSIDIVEGGTVAIDHLASLR